ncbi:MAG: WD40/YVTN/BNR-like repeat-containing protein, partial [bacterium]
MRIIKYFFIFAPLISVHLLAQQPAWELVRKDFWGKIAIDPTNPNIIYVSPGAAPGYGMYKSTDGGKTWVQYLTGYEGLGTEGIVIDPKNPQRLWVYGGAFRGIVRSENGAMTATRADTGIV